MKYRLSTMCSSSLSGPAVVSACVTCFVGFYCGSAGARGGAGLAQPLAHLTYIILYIIHNVYMGAQPLAHFAYTIIYVLHNVFKSYISSVACRSETPDPARLSASRPAGPRAVPPVGHGLTPPTQQRVSCPEASILPREASESSASFHSGRTPPVLVFIVDGAGSLVYGEWARGAAPCVPEAR